MLQIALQDPMMLLHYCQSILLYFIWNNYGVMFNVLMLLVNLLRLEVDLFVLGLLQCLLL